MSFFGRPDNGRSKTEDEETSLLEKEVLSSAQAQVDLKTVKTALITESFPQQGGKATPQWAAAIGASVAAGSVVFFTLQSLPFAIAAAVGIGFIASRNPVEEEDAAGAIARTVGRYTIASVEAATPKAKAMARAALTGEEELAELQERFGDLEMSYVSLQEENAQLRLWKRRRLWVDRMLSNYSLQELKDQARHSKLQVGGTKAQLLMRLVEGKVISPDLEKLESLDSLDVARGA